MKNLYSIVLLFVLLLVSSCSNIYTTPVAGLSNIQPNSLIKKEVLINNIVEDKKEIIEEIKPINTNFPFKLVFMYEEKDKDER